MTLPMPAAQPTRRVLLEVVGVGRYDTWTRVALVRDLGEISGSFDLEVDDVGRTASALPAGLHGGGVPFVKFQEVKIYIDSELVLWGWVDGVSPSIATGTVGCRVYGRDKTGQMVDCAAAPLGPVEYTNIKLERLAEILAAPWGITVSAEVDTGEPIAKVSIDTGETAMSVLEKYARKRAVLLVSDGVGGLIITRSGTGRAPDDLSFPGNVGASRGTFDGRKQFSVVYVKGQSGHAAGKRKNKAALDRTATPLDAPAEPAETDADEPSGRESRATAILGIAYDDTVPIYRPAVKTSRAHGSLKEADTEARWWVSTARGNAERVDYTMPDWRVNGRLWRPNEMTRVEDAYQLVDKDLLIAGTAMNYDSQGTRTELRTCGREAYDLLPESDDGDGKGKGKGRGKGKKHKSTDLDRTAEGI